MDFPISLGASLRLKGFFYAECIFQNNCSVLGQAKSLGVRFGSRVSGFTLHVDSEVLRRLLYLQDCSLGKQVWVHLLFAGRLACPIQDFKKSLSSFRGQRSLGLSLHFGFRLLVAIQSPTLDNELRVSLYFGFGLHQGMG